MILLPACSLVHMSSAGRLKLLQANCDVRSVPGQKGWSLLKSLDMGSMNGTEAMLEDSSIGFGRGPCSLYRAGPGHVRCCVNQADHAVVSRQQRKANSLIGIDNAACKRFA